MKIVGIIMFVAGVISAIYGNSLNNNMEAQWLSLLESGKTNTGNIWIIIGIIVAVIGIAMFVIDYIQSRKQ